MLTLDYGEDVAGIPYFQVESGSGQTAVKYSEPFDSLNSPYSDGLWDFVNDLMNTFRTELSILPVLAECKRVFYKVANAVSR